MYLCGFLKILLYFVLCVVVSVSGSVCEDRDHRIISDGDVCSRNLNVSCADKNISVSWIKPDRDDFFVSYNIRVIDNSTGELLNESVVSKEHTVANVLIAPSVEDILVRLTTFLSASDGWKKTTYTYKVCRRRSRISGTTTDSDELVDIKVVLNGSDVEGSTASLFCQINGCVAECTTFSWYKDRRPIDRNRTSESTLRFSRLQRTDAGQYICSASNRQNISANSTSFSLQVKYGPKTAKLTTSSTKYEEGKRLTLSCAADCFPPCSFKIIGKSASMDKATYRIASLDSERHNGEYYCIAKNKIGHKTSKIFDLDVQYGPRNVVIYGVEGKAFFLGEIKRSSVSCLADCNPPCNYTIKKNNTVVRNASWYDIGRVEADDEGYYRCIARNRISTSESGSQYLTVFVKPGLPTITQSQKYVNENDSIIWTCRASCKPLCQYVWYDYQEKKNISNTDQLKFTRVSRKNHTKVYRCSAYNGYGLEAENETLIVRYGPRTVVIYGVEGKTFFLGEFKWSSVSCLADCNPPCSYTIKKENTVVRYASSYYIGRVDAADEGYYTCVARNLISTSESETQNLTVFVKPGRPNITQSQIYVNENDSITWTCGVSCNPSCQYVWYDYQKKKNVSNTEYLKFTHVSRKYHNNVYRCSAYNDYGFKTVNETLTVRYAQVNIHPARISYCIREGNSLPEITCSSDCSPTCWSLYLYHSLGDRTSIIRYYPWKEQANSSTAGEYYCGAYYSYWTDSMYSTKVVRSSRINVSVTYDKLTIYPPKQTLIVKEYGTLDTLRCVLDCNPLCLHLEVYKDSIFFKSPQTSRPVFANRVLTRNDSGTYQCKAKTSDQNDLYSERRTVDVQYGPKLTLLSARNQTVKEGSNVSLRFRIEANPKAHVFVERTRAGYFNPTSRVYAFKNIGCELTGRHKLIANNSVGEDAENFILQVLCAPRILGLQKKDDFERKLINSSVMKSYKVYGYPRPKAMWKFKKKNSKQIALRVGEKDTAVELYSNGSYCHIVIDDIQEKHFGVYSIILTNSVGSLELNFELSPEGPPLPPSDVAVQCATPGQAKLIWRPQFQGGSPQTFKIYLRTNGTWDVLEENITDVRDNQGKIIKSVDRLSPEILHEFRVVAINDDMEEVNGSNEANCTVLGYPSQSSKDYLFSGIIGEVVGLVVVVILVTSLLIVSIQLLRKRNNQETNGSGMRNNALYGLTPIAPTGSEGNNVYSMANSTSTSQPAEQADEEKPVYAVAGQLPSQVTQKDEGNTYAAANYPTGDTDNVYSVTKTMAKKKEGDKVRDSGNVYTVANYAQEKGNEKQEQVYDEVDKEKKSTATKPKKSTKGGKPSIFPKPFWTGSKPSRMKNKDGLVYVEVDVKKLSKDRKGYIVGAENKTEYEEIDFTKHADPLPDTPPETSSETEEK